MKLITTVLLALSAQAAFAQGTWQDSTTTPALPNLPATVSHQGMGSANGRVYSFTGWRSGWQSETVQYDPSTNAWTALTATVPTALYDVGSASLNNRIYCMGGSAQGEVAQTSNFVFDAATGWSALATMPTARIGLTSVAHNGRIYAIGGRNIYYGAAMTAVEEFDPATNTWRGAAQGVPQLPAARSFVAAASVGNQVIVAGGYPDGSNTPSTVAYAWNPAAGGWSTLDSMPVGKGGGFGASMGGRFLLIGGVGGTQTVQQYDPLAAAGNRWSNITSSGFPFSHGAGAQLGFRFYLAGLGTATNWAGSTNFQAFQPPAIGNAPNAPTNFTMEYGAAIPVLAGGWMGGTSITFKADITDPDSMTGSPDGVALEVEAQPVGQPFTGPTATGSIGAQGSRSATLTGLLDGAYKVRYRALDAFGNQSAWIDHPTVPTFWCDQAAPPVPAAVTPVNEDIELGAASGPATLRCAAVIDGSGMAVNYEFRLYDPAGALIDQVTSGIPEASFMMNSSNLNYSWRVSSHDVFGNVSALSAATYFRAVHSDSRDNGAGDGVKACGMSTTGVSAWWILILLVLAIRR